MNHEKCPESQNLSIASPGMMSHCLTVMEFLKEKSESSCAGIEFPLGIELQESKAREILLVL